MVSRSGSVAVLVALLIAFSAVVPAVSSAATEGRVADAGVDSARDPETSTAHVQTRNAPAVAAASDGNLHQRTELSLTPDQPGQIAATTRYEIPDAVRSLEVTVPAAATVKTARGFSKEDGRTYVWDERTSSPRLVYDFSVNRTFEGARSPGDTGSHAAADSSAPTVGGGVQTADGDYSFVDVGSWAISPVPSMGVSWERLATQEVRLRRSATVDGEGATGGEIAYLGPLSEHTRTAHNQQFRLIVPRAASLQESPEDILDSLASASGRLAVGERDAEVFFVAAPTGVDWGPLGLESGGSDAWVRADSRLDTVTNVWLHEYVHTRTGFEPTDATRWTVEGAADYYAALLTFEQGQIPFDTFRDRLRRGTTAPASNAILADPTTWEGFANYLKGALVWGAIDFRIRTASDSSVDSVLARMNGHGEPVTATVFLDAVARASDSETRRFARQYTETRQTPDSWSQDEHSTAFTGPNLRASIEEATYTVSGPYRERSITADRTLVVEETLTASIPVTNAGDRSGVSEVSIRSDGETLVSETVDVAPGEEQTVTIGVALDSPGTYTVVTNGGTVTFTVAEPAPVTVQELAVEPSSVAVGESATASIVVTNDADRPAEGAVELTADGDRLGSERVRLDVDEQRTLTFDVCFDDAGVRQLRAGDASAALDVREQTTPTATAETGPLSVSIVVLAVLLAMVLVRRRESL